MKKLLTTFCVSVFLLMVLSSIGWGQLLTEDFIYTAGQNITSNGWSAFTHSGINPIKVTSPGLTYSGYAGSGVGNSATITTSMTTSGEDDYKTFTSQNSGSVYFSFMVNVSTATTTGDYFISLFYNLAGYAKIFAKKDGSGNLAFGICKIATASVLYTDYTYSLNVTYLLVAKYTFNSGTTTDDQVDLFINPGINGTEPASNITLIEGNNDATELGAILLWQRNISDAPSLIVDGIRVFTSWESVLPVNLSSFVSTVNLRNVKLNWVTESEVNNAGFYIERINNEELIINKWQNLGFINGHGTVNTPTNYNFEDRNLNTGKYKYRLKQIDHNGNYEYFELSGEVEVGVPKKYDLSQNYPNPFNPVTKINFDLPVDGRVSILIYDVTGREVARIINNEFKKAGYYTTDFSPGSLSSGVYFYVLSTDNFRAGKKMVVLK